MKEGTRNLLDKAARAIRAAEILVREGEREFGAGRAYYAMFYVAEALLHERGIRARSHSGIHALFGQHFAKAGLMDSKYHRWLLGAFDRRLEGDYGFTVAMTQEDVEAMIGQAREFLEEAERMLGDALGMI